MPHLLFILHLIGDFPMQRLAASLTGKRLRNRKWKPLLDAAAGSLLYMVPFALLPVLAGPAAQALLACGALFVAHLVIVSFQALLERNRDKNPVAALGSYLVGQLLHLPAILWSSVIIWGPNPLGTALMTEIASFTGLAWLPVHAARLASLLICASPTAVLVKLVLECVPKPQVEAVRTTVENGRPSLVLPEKKPFGNQSAAVASERHDPGMVIRSDAGMPKLNSGTLIGILERFLLLILGFSGQIGAIGFILAAKSLARFNQLNDREFAEKYLVGTLLSAFVALCCVVIVNGWFVSP